MFFDKITTKTLNNTWGKLHNSQRFGVKKLGIHPESKYFAMGSCFAEHVKLSLMRNGKVCLPDILSLDVPNTSKFDGHKFKRNHTNHYSPVSILQELDRVFDNPNDYKFEKCLIKNNSVK